MRIIGQGIFRQHILRHSPLVRFWQHAKPTSLKVGETSSVQRTCLGIFQPLVVDKLQGYRRLHPRVVVRLQHVCVTRRVLEYISKHAEGFVEEVAVTVGPSDNDDVIIMAHFSLQPQIIMQVVIKIIQTFFSDVTYLEFRCPLLQDARIASLGNEEHNIGIWCILP